MAVNLKIVSQVVTSGTPGPAGKSAYQIAVDNGFEGTESEWLKELHPFKGWFDSVSELEEKHSAPSVGEYAYVKGATSSDPVKIYECSTEGSWSDSGRTVDTTTVQTFRSGEAVNDIDITDNSSDIEENSDKIPTTGAVAKVLGNAEFSTGEKVKDVGIDSEPTAGSDNLVKSGGVQNELALGAVYDVSAKNPTAGFNNNGKWESLSALLSDANLNTLIPTFVRKGGMSVKFVQSFDNKYVQYRLMADNWTTDTTQWAICEDGVYVENPEFVYVKTDSEGKVLEGIKENGDKVICGDLEVGGNTNIKGDVKVLGSMKISGVSYRVIENQEYIAVWMDLENKVVFGLKTDGKTYVGDADFLDDIKDNKNAINEIQTILSSINTTIESLDLDALTSITAVENPEYIEAKTDSDGKLLAGRTPDGTAFENVGFTTPKVSIDGATIENIEDHESRIEILTDIEGKVISYRDSDGVKHEEVGIESKEITTDSLKLSGSGMTEFQQALKDAGFRPGGAGDYSETITNKGKNPVYIPMPICARLNILSDINLKALSKADKGGTQKVNYDVKVPVEFFDGQGIYFKKWVLISAQGNSSFEFEKKNLSLKFFDTENVENSKGKWGKGDTFGTVFGDWVMQKTYHLKAFYTDFIRGSSVVAYQLAEQVYKTRGEFADRPWKQALIDFNKISSVTPAGLSEDGIDDMALQIDNGARCMPDGFPVIVYQQGQFYGIFAWMLKKDAANFNMDENEARHIHLDGILTAASLWGGTINWSAFEIRNPEGLICMDGSDYDGDFPSEIIDNTSEHYDSSNPDHIKTAQVKQYIINLSQRVSEINTLDSTDSAAAKVLFDTYFDANNLIDYQVINMACGDNDGFGKNWQWITYDGIKWWCCQYDKDMSFGNYFTGMFTTNPKNGWINSSVSMPNGLAIKYYQSEHKSRWLQLVEANIFTAENVKQMVNDWVKRIGQYNFEKEWAKWPEAPCNRDSNIDFANWKFAGGYKEGVPTASGDVIWDAATQYSAGNRVWFRAFDGNWYLNFIAVQDNINKPCLTDSYSKYPKSMGYRDSTWRYFKYIEETFNNQNSFINSL